MIKKTMLLFASSLLIAADGFSKNNKQQTEVSNTAPVKCTKTIVIHAQPEKVWQLLTEIEQWHIWQKEISHATQDGEMVVGSSFKWKSGGVKIRSILHTVQPYQALGWSGRAIGTRAIHNWTITEEAGNTIVTVSESMQGLVPNLFKKSMSRKLDSSMANWLAFLKEAAEL